jgi:hypothetical protein
MDAKPKRRWYQFSLRTMFVLVTIVCVSAGLTVKWVQFSREWIRQRQDALHHRDERIAGFSTSNPSSRAAPVLLRPFGESGVITVYVRMEEDIQYAKQLFPESDVKWVPN